MPAPARIQEIFVDPPLAVARLGGSSAPQDAYVWVPAPEPRAGGTTNIAPAWSLRVQHDATVVPILPTRLIFRDDDGQIRPVCPFFEVWARVGRPGSAPSSWSTEPLTPALLAAEGAMLSDLSLIVDAKNLKVARRTGRPELAYGTFPPVRVAGDERLPVALLAVSPAGPHQLLIPQGNSIPMGAVQMIRSRQQPQNADWAQAVNVEVIRFRLTPARGLMYGVPDAALPKLTDDGQQFVPVDAERAFLNPLAGWSGVTSLGLDQPADTYDGADVTGNRERSFGVIDDTCEVRFDLTLRLPGRARDLTATACAFVGPPDFAPDRRPFLSLADELNDRGAHGRERTAAMTGKETDDWVQDLFERIFEVVSLFNVDHQRDSRGMLLTGGQLRRRPIPNDDLPMPSHAMGRRDALRNEKLPALPDRSEELLPLTRHAVNRHEDLADITQLKAFISENPGRLRQLIRKPFEVEAGADIYVSSMRMPPFMRNSNALPLTLSEWQYELLMGWVSRQKKPAAARKRAKSTIKKEAVEHRKRVLQRLNLNQRPPRPRA